MYNVKNKVRNTMFIEKLTEVVSNVALAIKAIANRRLKADLYGLKAEKAHVSGKMLSRCVRSPSTHVFFNAIIAARACEITVYNV